jgi:hypothetical protein
MTATVDTILDRAIAGQRLARGELVTLFEEADLIELGQAAHLERVSTS